MHIDNASGYIEEVNEDKYLVFDVRDDDDDDWLEYTKNYMKIKFNSDDNLPLNKPLKFYQMTVTIRYVFSEINFIHKYFRWSFA